MQNRRQFFRTALGSPWLLALAPSVPTLWLHPTVRAAAPPQLSQRVLVVVQLTGGNDGLNTVVPFEDDAYGRNRPTLRLPTAGLHKLNDQLGLHPCLGAFARLYHDGELAIVQGVGCAGLSRDHEAALRTWQTGTPKLDNVYTGWLGRAADRLWRQSMPATPAVFVGRIPRPFGLNAAAAVVPSLHHAREAIPGLERQSAEFSRPETSQATARGGASPADLLGHVQATRTAARAYARSLETVLQSAATEAVRYPECALGEDLRTVAQLIRAEIGIRIYYTELGGGGIGGFDNHANQLGNHDALLQQLAESVGAFAADLARARLFDQVLLCTFSEFGRTVAENGRRGTDHGLASPQFLVGGKVRGGLHGPHPSLTDLGEGALKHHTDFRAVYATILEDWLGLPSAEILGADYPKLALIASA